MRKHLVAALAMGLFVISAPAGAEKATSVPSKGRRAAKGGDAALRNRLRPLIHAAVQKAMKKMHATIERLRHRLHELQAKLGTSAPHLAKDIEKVSADAKKEGAAAVKAASEESTQGVATQAAEAVAAHESGAPAKGEASAPSEGAGAPAGAETAAPAPKEEPASAGAASGGIVTHDDPRLSAARKKLFAELEKRIPSMEGQKAAPGKINLFDGVAHQKTGTSCGLLPAVLMRKLGVTGVITQYATEGLRTEAKRLNVWVDNDGTTLPKPGDLYWLRYEDKPETDSVAHVGVIYDVNKQDPNVGLVWVTADAGQGSRERQEAKLVNRQMKKVDNTHFFLSGPKNTPGDSSAFRRIGGWIDLDKLVK
jgi:hypothetical protein